MPRQNRIFVEGGMYHVYNRLGRGERAFDQEMEAAAFVGLLRDIVERYRCHPSQCLILNGLSKDNIA